jgi:hypothetical protein
MSLALYPSRVRANEMLGDMRKDVSKTVPKCGAYKDERKDEQEPSAT